MIVTDTKVDFSPLPPLTDDGTGDSFGRFSAYGLETIIQRAWEEMRRRAHTRAAFDLIQKARKELVAAGSDWVLELKGNGGY